MILVSINLLLFGANAESVDVSLSLSVEPSKIYDYVYRFGLRVLMHNVTLSGRLVNSTNNFGIPYQSVSLHYKNVSGRLSTQDSEWAFINNTLTDTQGNYSYLWIPPVREFPDPEEYEVIYQVKAVWEHGDFAATDSEDVYISSLEYTPPSPLGSLVLYVLQPFLVTGLFLAISSALSIVAFNKFGGKERVTEKAGLKKTLLYLVSILGLIVVVWCLPRLSVHWIPVQAQAFVLFLPFVIIPAIIPLLSIPRFFRYLRRGNKLKTILSSMVIAWSVILILIFASTLFSIMWVSLLFFQLQGAYGPLVVAIYVIGSEIAIFALFLLLVFLKEEKSIP